MDQDTFKSFHDYWKNGDFSINIETWYQTQGKRLPVDVKDFYELREFQRVHPSHVKTFATQTAEEAMNLYLLQRP